MGISGVGVCCNQKVLKATGNFAIKVCGHIERETESDDIFPSLESAVYYGLCKEARS